MGTMSDTLDEKWLDLGGFRVGSKRPTPTSRIRDHLQELSGRSLRLVKTESYGWSSGYYLREAEKREAGEPQAQWVMAIDAQLPSLVLGLSVEKGEEVAGAEPGRRMNRSTWDWPALVALRAATFEAEVAAISRATEHPVAIMIWTDREDVSEDWNFSFVSGQWLHRAVRVSARDVLERLEYVDGERSRWCDVWIGCELGRKEMRDTTYLKAAKLLHAFSPLRDRLRSRRTR